MNTKIAIPPQFWNQKKGCTSEKLPEVFGNVKEISDELRRMLRMVEDIISYGIKRNVTDMGDYAKGLLNQF